MYMKYKFKKKSNKHILFKIFNHIDLLFAMQKKCNVTICKFSTK